MSSYRGTLYIGVTNDLARRVYEHQHKLVQGFTERYKVSKLVYYETSEDVKSAIAREKQVKGWRRSKKVALIEMSNPYWVDLTAPWDGDSPPPQTLRFAQGDNESPSSKLKPRQVSWHS
jgi:putative endonuclease